MKIRKPLSRRLIATGCAAVLFVGGAIGGIGWYWQSSMNSHAIETEHEGDLRAIQADMALQLKVTAGIANALAARPDLPALVDRNAREDLLLIGTVTLPALKRDAGIHNVTFFKAPATTVARWHDPTVFGDDVSNRRKTVPEAVRTGKMSMGVEPGRVALAVFSTAPLRTGDRVVGTVDVGTSLAADYFQRLKTARGADITVHVPAEGGFAVQSATFDEKSRLDAGEIKAAFEGRHVRRDVTDPTGTFAISTLPVEDITGKTIAILEVGSDMTTMAAQRRSSFYAMGASTVLIALLSVALFALFARSLARPIRHLTDEMNKLAAGDLGTAISGEAREDEIGAMARAVAVFKENSLALERATEEQRRLESMSAAERAGVEAERAQSAERLAGVVRELAGGLSHLTEGDLTYRIEAAFPAEYAKLKTDFNAAMEQLEDSMATVVDNVGKMKTGASEVTQAADDLSRRTEQQAASLEETAAALDQITATVRKSAEGAQHARETVAAANADASRSSEIVTEAVGAMSGIESSSREIAQIIGVIDEIAFQTNLLALNAGVEAARAGEAGRGFAVVASEVRALAQRSASAAQEIKGLIAASRDQVAKGVGLVRQSGEALSRISTRVVELDSVVAEIAASAAEQATGLSQINTAVNQMDQVTQQNAAMVEQSTAASHAMAGEADALFMLTRRFRTGAHRDEARAGRLRPAA